MTSCRPHPTMDRYGHSPPGCACAAYSPQSPRRWPAAGATHATGRTSAQSPRSSEPQWQPRACAQHQGSTTSRALREQLLSSNSTGSLQWTLQSELSSKWRSGLPPPGHRSILRNPTNQPVNNVGNEHGPRCASCRGWQRQAPALQPQPYCRHPMGRGAAPAVAPRSRLQRAAPAAGWPAAVCAVRHRGALAAGQRGAAQCLSELTGGAHEFQAQAPHLQISRTWGVRLMARH